MPGRNLMTQKQEVKVVVVACSRVKESFCLMPNGVSELQVRIFLFKIKMFP